MRKGSWPKNRGQNRFPFIFGEMMFLESFCDVLHIEVSLRDSVRDLSSEVSQWVSQ